MNGRRSDLEISAEILQIAKNGARKSHIVYKANLNFKIINKYIKRLEGAGLLTRLDRIFKTTDKGDAYLNHFATFRDFVDWR